MLTAQREPPGAAIQTFLPYAEYAACARVLDDRRLGKQRVEALQIMQVLTSRRRDPRTGRIEAFAPKGWQNHPAVLMWRGFEASLDAYQRATCAAWTARGFADTCAEKSARLLAAAGLNGPAASPPWLGDQQLHRSHRSNLIRKDPAYYGPLFPGVPPDLPYVWPVVAADGV
jgi:hypothetical protein